MINRELIRIKIVQLTYAYYQNGNRNMDNAEKELLFSLAKAYDLYNYLLALIVSVTQEERHRVEIAANRATREGTEAPSQRFAYNKFAVQLEENKQLNLFMENQKRRWEDDMEAVRKLCDQIEQSTIYKEYMASEDDSYDVDREVWRKIYRTLIQENPDLDAVLEERSLYWNDDKEVVDNADVYQRYMSEASRNWDFSRLAYMDVVIMQIAIAEMLTFPNIPVSVTINEYVDLAKLYSTPRSGGYINGMLDTIARHLVQTGKMMKAMPEPRQRRNRDDRQEERDFRREGRRPTVAETSAQRLAERQRTEEVQAENLENDNAE